MSEDLEFFDNSTPPSGNEMSMVETWIAAVTKPSESTFAEIAAQPDASAKKAFLWVGLASLVTSFFSAIAQSVGMGQSTEMLKDFLPPDLAYALPSGSSGGMSFGAIICGAPLGAILGVIFFAIGVGVIQWVAKLFGGTGSFDKLAYTFAAITVPISVVSVVLTLLGMIPFVGILTGLISFGLLIYAIVLEVLAVKAVNELDTGKAVGSVLLPGVVFFVFVCCCLVVFGALLTPAIGEVFNEINQSLY
ncbi:MAG: YIP1 family protein [Anaerolineae bacterium]|jgi:hypothetical protein|nr:YIP1 family protein [Anaerolineae bacterium]MBT7071276.1 YIP1 family protein [Anaerolineae bacterium]MBT7325900.1 YIP1 family protein [Anaerolineae bacterium]